MGLTLANIKKTAQRGDYKEAEKLLVKFLGELFSLDITTVEIRRDSLSLNSVNGFVKLKDGKILFFKFHQEENEEALTEYYNSMLLSENGYPVEMPLYISKEVGKQVLLYPLKTAERMADICKKFDFGGDAKKVIEAQQELDKLSAEKYIATLHEATPKELRAEPILQLFYNRLVNGGRYKQFYEGKDCELPGGTINFEELKKLKWRINGLDYNQSLENAFAESFKVLSPEAHGNYQAVIAHGDAHNGNVWFNDDGHLSLFDPAFAARNIPALLAEINATFHNIFAHPLWLYDSKEAKFDIGCKIGDVVDVIYDWRLSPLREAFLASKIENLWAPLLKKLKLPENWQVYMRLALFCCPTLVMNLRANAGSEQNSHTPKTSLLGFAIAIMLSSPPANGKDMVSEFFAKIKPK